MQSLAVWTKQSDPRDLSSVRILCCSSTRALVDRDPDRDPHHIMSSLSVSKNAWREHHTGGIQKVSLISLPHQQMTRQRADSSASDVSASGHSDNNKSKTIATGAVKVFNKIILKSRPSAIKSPAEEASARFQIVHTPDRSPVEMPLSGFPTTNEEFDAAISRINLRGQLQGVNASFEQKGSNICSRKRSQRNPHSVRYVIAMLDSRGHSLLNVKSRFQK